jgi:hypothetical protein
MTPNWLAKSRNHLPYIVVMAITLILGPSLAQAQEPLKLGVAEVDITPPVGFPMAGYFHERLADGQLDPLKAKAIVFKGNGQQAALVVCDLTGVSVDLAQEIRKLAATKTGIPASHIVVSATHSHTAPDYYKSLVNYLSGDTSNAMRSRYVQKLIQASAEAIEKADLSAGTASVYTGSAEQKTPVAFNRRFVLKNGSVQTWLNLKHPDVVRIAGPIDPQIGLMLVKDANQKPIGLLSNFALHLDTVGGLKWSGDYPYFVETAVRQALGPQVVSLFGTGCCGDINHSNSDGVSPRNKTDVIGQAIGETIKAALPGLTQLKDARLAVKRQVVPLPLQQFSAQNVADSQAVMADVEAGKPVEFLKHVQAHKTLMANQLRHKNADDKGARLATRAWAGVGESLPVEVHTICLGDDLAIVTLPGEVFVNLGLAIKQNSPFKNTIIIELANAVETCYIPTRAAYAGGSYEVTNSTVKPGSGEILVEAALTLLREARAEQLKPAK